MNDRVRRLLIGLLLALGLAAAATATEAFRLYDLEGRVHTIDAYRGQWVLVNYWATWCPPCIEELPELERFHAGADGAAVVLGVNAEEITESRLRGFVARHELTFPILPAGERPARAGLVGPLDGLPTSYLIAPDGELVARQVGRVTAEGIAQFIRRHEGQNAEESSR
jgi:thiol-disulfide isomerase/thioredoxin